MEFDPVGQLAQARKDNPALDAAYNRAEEEKVKYLEPLVDYFARLEEEIANMPMAQRFSRKHGPNFDYDTGRGIRSPLVGDLNEAEYKRTQLLFDVQRAKSMAMRLIGNLEGIILDMEAAKID